MALLFLFSLSVSKSPIFPFKHCSFVPKMSSSFISYTVQHTSIKFGSDLVTLQFSLLPFVCKPEHHLSNHGLCSLFVVAYTLFSCGFHIILSNMFPNLATSTLPTKFFKAAHLFRDFNPVQEIWFPIKHKNMFIIYITTVAIVTHTQYTYLYAQWEIRIFLETHRHNGRTLPRF